MRFFFGMFDFILLCQGFNDNLHAVFCLAENAVGPIATRPDDIHTLYSGKYDTCDHSLNMWSDSWRTVSLRSHFPLSCLCCITKTNVCMKDRGDKQHWCWRQAGSGWRSGVRQQRFVSRYHSGHGHADRCSGMWSPLICWIYRINKGQADDNRIPSFLCCPGHLHWEAPRRRDD